MATYVNNASGTINVVVVISYLGTHFNNDDIFGKVLFIADYINQGKNPDKMISFETLQQRLQLFNWMHKPAINRKNRLTKASVLVPLILKDGDVHVLLTVRSKELRLFSGHVAFPGGKMDESDKDEISAALREANEEIGLLSENLDVIASLPPVRVSLFSVHAVIGIIRENFLPQLNRDEVSDIFQIPLLSFLESKGESISIDQLPLSSFVFNNHINGEVVTVWGFTAIICVLVAVVVYHGNMMLKDRQIFEKLEKKFLSKL